MRVQRNALSVVLLISQISCALAGSPLMDATGRLLTAPSTASTADGVVALVSSPGTPSPLVAADDTSTLSLESESPACLVCRGATLSGISAEDRHSLSTCSLVADSIVLDGVTLGDIESGFRTSRHARTLSSLFRARLLLLIADSSDAPKQQTLWVRVPSDVGANTDLEKDIQALYRATAVETKGAPAFAALYDLKVLSAEADVLQSASEAAKASPSGSASLQEALNAAVGKVRSSAIGTAALDPPHIASAFVAVGAAYGKQTRTARAKITSWKTRIARGLLIDGFGSQAESLRQRVLGTFEKETLGASGLPQVAQYRAEQRQLLQNFVDSAILQLFAAQVSNLSKATLKRFNAALLKTMNDNPESIVESNAVTLRKETFAFENVMGDLEVPSLGLSKERATREIASKLTDAMTSFPDSAAAKIKRMNQVSKVVNKEKKPGERGVAFGLDLVAVLRPDGFGTLQGYAGYQLGGNSLTFGIHNDADDPQTIAQFGGVRPPLLRVQPKLRVDVEL